jgi:hypothetical protein
MARKKLKPISIRIKRELYKEFMKDLCSDCLVRMKCIEFRMETKYFDVIRIDNPCFRLPHKFKVLKRKYNLEFTGETDGGLKLHLVSEKVKFGGPLIIYEYNEKNT